MIQQQDRFIWSVRDDNKVSTTHYLIHYRKIVEVEPSPLYFLETLTWMALRKMLS